MRGRGWATTSDVTKTRSPRRRSTMPAPKARTRRWAPPMLTRRTSSKSSGLVSSAVPGWILAALDTRISTGPNAASRLLGEPRPPRPGRPGRGGRPPPLPPRPGWTRPPRRTPRRGAPRARRDGPPGPAPAPPRRRCPRRRPSPPSAGVRGGARSAASAQRHRGRQRGEAPHVDGVHALACPPGRPRSPSPAARTSVSATRASMRASAAPMQKWRPLPKLTRSWVRRSRS